MLDGPARHGPGEALVDVGQHERARLRGFLMVLMVLIVLVAGRPQARRHDRRLRARRHGDRLHAGVRVVAVDQVPRAGGRSPVAAEIRRKLRRLELEFRFARADGLGRRIDAEQVQAERLGRAVGDDAPAIVQRVRGEAAAVVAHLRHQVEDRPGVVHTPGRIDHGQRAVAVAVVRGQDARDLPGAGDQPGLQDRDGVDEVVAEDLPRPGPVGQDRPQALHEDRAFVHVFPAGVEDAPVGQDLGRELVDVVGRERAAVAPVGVHHKEGGRADPEAERPRLAAGRSEPDPPVGQVERVQVVKRPVGQLAQARPVDVHLVDVVVALFAGAVGKQHAAPVEGDVRIAADASFRVKQPGHFAVGAHGREDEDAAAGPVRPVAELGVDVGRPIGVALDEQELFHPEVHVGQAHGQRKTLETIQALPGRRATGRRSDAIQRAAPGGHVDPPGGQRVDLLPPRLDLPADLLRGLGQGGFDPLRVDRREHLAVVRGNADLVHLVDRALAHEPGDGDPVELEMPGQLRVHGAGRLVGQGFGIAEHFGRVAVAGTEGELDDDHVRAGILLTQWAELARLPVRRVGVVHYGGGPVERRPGAVVVPDLQHARGVRPAGVELDGVEAEIIGAAGTGNRDAGNPLQETDVERGAVAADAPAVDQAGLVQRAAAAHVQQAHDPGVAVHHRVAAEAGGVAGR